MNESKNLLIADLPQDALSALIDLEQKGILPDFEYWEEPYAFLARLGLIEHTWENSYTHRVPQGVSIPMNAMKITDKGRLYLAKHRANKRRDFVMGRRYWITTGVSVLALIISVIALAAEVGLLRLPTL